MRERKSRFFVGDFETTVYKGQDHTEVWAAACVELFNDEVKIFHSIDEQFEYFASLDSNIICYYHNLKFDGAFWLSYFLIDRGFKQATMEKDERTVFLPIKDMKADTITYSISDMGQWYRIDVKHNGHIFEFRDSLKLLPFSVKHIGDSFETKHKKLDMEYTGFRYAGCEITEEEQKYIANDTLVIKEAIEIMFEEGHKKLTIGSCCLAEYRNIIGYKEYQKLFPNLYAIAIDKDLYGTETAGEYIRKSYRGGWCYLAKGKEGKIYHNGTTADVNSLYPSMMSSESLNAFPIGEPTFWKGDIPQKVIDGHKYFFVRIITRFNIKKGKLPFIQIKNNLAYRGTEMLETSDIEWRGNYRNKYIDFDGSIKEAFVILTLTCTDWKLFNEHYNLINCKVLDGCYFESRVGIFDDYIEKYKKIKLESTGAKRQLAKLFLNNLYGKMASSPDSSYKVAYIKEDKSIGFYTELAYDKIPGYIAVGSAITSYARNFTIRAAQINYYGVDKPGFIYADTDSIHCDLMPDKIKGIREDSKDFCCWKLESCWDTAIFTRQKTYIEHVTHENRQPLDKPQWDVKCAGMPEKCKDLFIKSMEGYEVKPEDKYTYEEKEFLSTKRELSDFTVGLKIPGKLLPKRIRGGVLLCETTYEMR